MANVFAYTGYRRVYYFKYLDIRAGHTLVADPGQQYEIQATESDIPVPPGDGLWSLIYPSPLKSVSNIAVTETSAPRLVPLSEVTSEEVKNKLKTKSEPEPESEYDSDPEPEPDLETDSKFDLKEPVTKTSAAPSVGPGKGGE